MASLAEVYDGVGGVDLRRLYLGTALFVGGASMVVMAIVVATTDVLDPFGVHFIFAREIAGILAGLGAPAVFVGIFTVLPASRRERAAAAIGASVAVFGVLLFSYAYPGRWVGMSPDLALPVVAVYFVGAITTFWSMFTAIVNFKTRNDPGGTVTIKRTVEGETKLVEVPVTELEGKTVSGTNAGSVGLLGDVGREQVVRESGDEGVEVTAGDTASDGGTETLTPAPEPTTEHEEPGEGPGESATDRYCGTCRFFEYTQERGEIEPYCAFHDEIMTDMEACERWKPNAPR